MKKLILSIVIPATMLCCQSENIDEITETSEEEVNCLVARRSAEGDITSIHDHWQNSEKLDGYVKQIPSGYFHDFHCFNVSKYTRDQMIQLIKNKY